MVSDVEMPGMRGTELVNVIRQISPGTVQVLMTGALTNPGAMPGGVPLVRKPVSLKELVAAARAAVEHSERLMSDFVRNQKQFEELKARRRRFLAVFGPPEK